MTYTSLNFPLFLIMTMAGYYTVFRNRQNYFLLAANIAFYVINEPIYALLLFSGIIVTYFIAFAIERGKRKKLWLILNILYMFGMLFVFKYLSFTLRLVSGLFGFPADSVTLHIVLPVGISFFSFTMVGYAIDVYRGKTVAERDFIAFAAFASFFPSILSGPINRADRILPQLREKRTLSKERCKRGLFRYICGWSKKLVLAGLCIKFVDTVYGAPYDYGSGMWFLAAVCYSVQIYIDFVSYSDMAIGTADMLGITLPENFTAPYLSRSVKDFWRKWHISLTSWFRDYIYFSLGGNRKGKYRTYLNILIVFTVSGLWHGAAVTFILWGALNGLYQIFGELLKPIRERMARPIPDRIRAVLETVFTFGLITASWIFFRASSVSEAWFIIRRILLIVRDGFGAYVPILNTREILVLLFSMAGCFLGDALTATERSSHIEKTTLRYWLSVSLIVAFTLLFGCYGSGFDAQAFVYFRF